MTKVSKWDDATIEKLKDLYLNKQHTANEIAKALGFTKNAIIGKIHRLNLNNEKISNTGSIKKEKTVQKNIKNYGHFKLEDIDFGMCVWPENTIVKKNEDRFTFCGKTVLAGKSYCQHHLSLVYLGTKKSAKSNDLNIYKDEDILE